MSDSRTSPTSPAPRVSVIMPFFDLQRFIAESIESVMAQRFAAWELILVDDGSSDASTEIARDYVRRDPSRIRCLTHENRQNRGASASRNLAIRHARGEYLALLDADDVWLPEKLEEQVALLDAHPGAGSLYGRTLFWYSWTGRRRDRNRDFLDHRHFPSGTVLHPPDLLVAMLRGKAAIPGTCSLLVRRSIVQDISGFEEQFTRLFTDQVFYAKLFLRAPVLVSDRCWDKYRRHPDSSVSQAERAGEFHAQRLAYLNWLRRYMEAAGARYPELDAALDAALRPYRHPRLYALVNAGRKLHHLAGDAFWHRALPAAVGLSRILLPERVRSWLWRRLQSIAHRGKRGGHQKNAPE